MQQQVVDVEKVLQCKDCVYDEYKKHIKYCGPCDQKNIEERIKWWQEGKKELRGKSKE